MKCAFHPAEQLLSSSCIKHREIEARESGTKDPKTTGALLKVFIIKEGYEFHKQFEDNYKELAILGLQHRHCTFVLKGKTG